MGAELAPGIVIDGRYRVDRLLGQGGMGTVWAATHVVTHKTVALKVLVESASQRPEMRRRFQREARAASAVTHPNVVAVHDVFEMDDGAPVMVMDLLTGEPLDNRLLREGRLSVEETARILLPVVSAVGTIHEHGIVHRDLKPANIFLADEAGGEVVKVLDFGIAKLTSAENAVSQSGVLTSTGAMMGTPFYMAPEQCAGEKDVDHRVDVWALGVILYECLSGRRPIVAENLGQVIKKVLMDGVAPLDVPGLPEDVAKLVGRMLSRDRGDRPQDLREVKVLLEAHAPAGTKVPSFGAPATRDDATPAPTPPARSNGRVIAGAREVDPEAKTADAGSGAELASARAVRVSARPRRGLAVGALLFVVAAGLGGALWIERAPSPAAQAPLPSASVAPSIAAPSPSIVAIASMIAPDAPAPSRDAAVESAEAVSTAAPAPRPAGKAKSPPARAASAPPVAPASPPVATAAPAASTPQKPGTLIERPPF